MGHMVGPTGKVIGIEHIPELIEKSKQNIKEDNPEFLEEVWLEGAGDLRDPWLTDATVRAGIRAMQMIDRCAEERARVTRETHQLYMWAKTRTTALNAVIARDTRESSVKRGNSTDQH